MRAGLAPAVVLLAACTGGPRPAVPPAARVARESSWSGRVEVDGAPAGGVEVVLLDASGRALAAAQADAAGGFELRGPSASAAFLAAKIDGPVVGAVVEAAGPPRAGVPLRFESSTAVTLTLRFRPPGGAAIDWLDVGLTPHALAGVPAATVEALSLAGTGPARRDAFAHLRVTGPEARVRLQPGTWAISVRHIVERPKAGGVAVPPNCVASAVTLSNGEQAAAEVGLVQLAILRDTAVEVALQPLPGR